MPIDCNAFCNNDSQRKINMLIGKNNSEEMQNEVIAHRMCIIDCERRNNDAARRDDDPPLPTHRSSGGNRKNTSAKLKVPGLALGVAFTAVAQITVKRRLEGSWLLRRCLTGFLFHKIDIPSGTVFQRKIEMFNLVFNHFNSLQVCPLSLNPPSLLPLPSSLLSNLSSPPRNTESITPVLGTHTNKTRHLIFIPSNITTLRVKNTPNYMATTSLFFANMSPRSPDGIIAPVGHPRIAPRPMDTWMSAPGRNTHCMARTRFSRISRGVRPPTAGATLDFDLRCKTRGRHP